jgi:preprotein translocase subunit YajC
MLITPAFAQTGGAPGGFDLVSLMPLLLIFVVFYFLLIRPQQKKMKAHKEMISAVRRGDSVVTAGGIMGKVTKVVDDSTLQVEIAEGVRVRVVRGTITEVRAKGEPANEAGGSGGAVKRNDDGDEEKGGGSLLSKLMKK